jgi:hypothetical protein
VELYLARRVALVGNLPLRVSLGGALVGFLLPNAGFSALLHRLAPQLKSLKLEVEATGLVPLDHDPPSFPLLEKLAVILDDGINNNYPYPESLEHLFVDAPRLQEVFMRSGTVARLMEFPWKQLKKFEGERVPLEDGRYILRSGENLVECILSLIEDGTYGGQRGTLFTRGRIC